MSHLRTTLRRAAPLALLSFTAACGPAGPQGGGFHGFPPAEVTTQTLAPRSFPVSFEYVGQTIGSKDVEVRARVTGIVEKRLYQEGSPVKAGQPLFVIDPKPYAAQVAAADADLARAQAQKAQADREAARLKPLAERKAIGQKEADDAASNADLAAAAVKSAQAKLDELKLNWGYTRVVAPIAGLSSRAQVSEGALATQNTTLLTTISQTDPIWVAFTVSENERLRLSQAIASGTLAAPKDNAYEVTIKLSDGSAFPRRGRINFSDTRVNPTTGTYEMRAEVPNGDLALKPGQFVRVVLRGAQRRDALAVPQTAVLDGPQGKFVYVAGKDKDGKDVAQPRPVSVGDWVDATGGNLWVIENGLKAGDTVITDGVAKIMSGGPIHLAGAAPAGPTAGAAPAGAAPGGTSAQGAVGGGAPADPAKAPAKAAPAADAGKAPAKAAPATDGAKAPAKASAADAPAKS
jgi:membrane fusion protein, multidrug efflux system